MINKIFPPINFPLTNIISIMRVSKPSTIPVNDDFLGSCWLKTTFPPGKQCLVFLLFEDKGRLQIHCNIITRRLLTGQSLTSELEGVWLWEESSREFATADLAYLIAGLVTITQFRSWARWPNRNGVIHTISIGDNLCWLFCEKLILLPDNNSVSFQTAPQHFISYGICTEMVVTYTDTLYIITGWFLNSLRHVALYFNWHTITQYITQ